MAGRRTLMFDWPVHHPHTEGGRYTDTTVLLFPRPIRRLMELFFQGHAYHLMHHMYPASLTIIMGRRIMHSSPKLAASARRCGDLWARRKKLSQ
jgi:hypothetical protein